MDITGIFNTQTLFCIMKYNITEKVKHVPDGISIPSKKLIFGLCIEKKMQPIFFSWHILVWILILFLQTLGAGLI